MKFFFSALFLFSILVAACHPNPANYTVPAGYKTCTSDLSCPRGYYCGFVGVDTYAVCKHR